jgi:hypothetical protein
MCILKSAWQGDISRAWRQVKLMFILAPRKANYTKTKAYCPIRLLSFIHKTMEKLAARHIRDNTLGFVPYIYTNVPTKQGSQKKPQYTM